MKQSVRVFGVLALAMAGCCGNRAAQHPNIPKPVVRTSSDKKQLATWSDGRIKKRILRFVADVTTPGRPTYLPPSQRLAVFDLDGTVLCEKPEYIEVVLALQRLKELARKDPRLASKQPYKAALANDSTYISKYVNTVLFTAFAGMRQKQFREHVLRFLKTTKHPRLNKPYIELYYRPMKELIELLHKYKFRVYVSSTSMQEYIRAFVPHVLGIPVQRIIGSTIRSSLKEGASGVITIIRSTGFDLPHNSDRGKVQNIWNRIGGRPIIAAGNSMGDSYMLRFTSQGPMSLVLVINHDDVAREGYSYSKPKLLDLAKKSGWIVVGIKNTFRLVF